MEESKMLAGTYEVIYRETFTCTAVVTITDEDIQRGRGAKEVVLGMALDDVQPHSMESDDFEILGIVQEPVAD